MKPRPTNAELQVLHICRANMAIDKDLSEQVDEEEIKCVQKWLNESHADEIVAVIKKNKVRHSHAKHPPCNASVADCGPSLLHR